MNKPKLTIGVVIASLHEACQSQIWLNINSVARQQNINIVTYVGSSQDQIESLVPHYNVITDFILNSELDGLIVFAGAIAEHESVEKISQFCTRLSARMPVVTLSLVLPDTSSIMVDNAAGIGQMVNHLVDQHNYSHIAFIKGPEGHKEAEERFAAYKDGLKENDIPFDERLVFPGSFSEESGAAAVAELIREKTSFDAILAVDDETAFGAVNALKKSGIHVPTEVAVVGFDDVAEAAMTLPSMSTIRQPSDRIAEKAIELLITANERIPIPELCTLPTKPVFRRSCGCFSQSIKGIMPSLQYPEDMTRQEVIEDVFEQIYAVIAETDTVEMDKKQGLAWAARLLDSFADDVHKPDGQNRFLNTVDALVFKISDFETSQAVIQILTAELMAHLNALFRDQLYRERANNIVQQCQMLLKEYRLKEEQTTNLDNAMIQLQIRDISQKIVTTFEQKRLLFAIEHEFHQIKIPSFSLALYPKGDHELTSLNWKFPAKSELLLAYNRDSTFHGNKLVSAEFNTVDMAPLELDLFKQTKSLIFMPLFFEHKQFGFVCFEYFAKRPLFMYEELRLHIGSSLQSAQMLNSLKIESMMDPLTGIYNRRGFLKLGKKMIEMGRASKTNSIVFYADLDGLKTINDNFGHDEGDIAIRAAADALKKTFRDQDVIGRLGGDEFTAIIAAGNMGTPEKQILKRLQHAVDDFNASTDYRWLLGISVGISAVSPGDTRALEEVLKDADDKLRINKKHRKQAKLRTS